MATVQNLHLQYRLWIAELNADINVLRIFDDYLSDISTRKSNNGIAGLITNYRTQFIALRKEMDELRHEMHLNKMKLAAIAKTDDLPVKNIENNINHETIKQRYEIYRKRFDTFKQMFQQFESKETV